MNDGEGHIVISRVSTRNNRTRVQRTPFWGYARVSTTQQMTENGRGETTV
jgi:hypothetical protein